jgi:dUTP pyrophosphatase
VTGPEEITVEVARRDGCDDLPLPGYMSEGSSGMDLRAAVDAPLVLARGTVALVPTGLHIAVPRGYEAQIRPRSGLAVKHGVTVLNTPGTIDSDYRGEVKIILANLGAHDFTVERGMRVAQMVLQRVVRAAFAVRDTLEETARGHGGFGHTGV